MAKRLYRRIGDSSTISGNTVALPTVFSTSSLASTGGATSSTTPLVTLSSTSASPLSSTSPLSLTSSLPAPLSTDSALTSSTTSGKPKNTGSPNSNLSNDSGISVGEIIGASIGSFFAGVLLALIAALLFIMLKKKRSGVGASASRRRSYRGSEGHHEDGPSSKEMGTVVRQREVGTDVKLERILLEPVPSQEIKTQMMMINNEILQHVDNNYHLKTIDVAPADIAKLLTKAGYESSTGLAVDQLGVLLQDVKYRRAAIRHLISWFILSNIALTTDPNTSLLPSYITAFLRQMPPPENVTGSKEAFDFVLNKWRATTAYLLQNVRSNRDPLVLRDRDVRLAITNNMNLIQPILQPFIKPGNERRQAENLRSLLLEGAKFGLLLFQQPESWGVEWKEPLANKQGGRGGQAAVILFPGLVRTVTDEGSRYTEAKVILPAEVMHL